MNNKILLLIALFPFFNSLHVNAKWLKRQEEIFVFAQKLKTNSDLSSKKQSFINFLLPHILSANMKIQEERKRVLDLYGEFSNNKSLSLSDLNWLLQISQSYGLRNFNAASKDNWIELIKRVDIVPVPLAIAQAASESAWGTSRFAKEGNNFFGQWCFTFSCGLIPKNRSPGAKHEVKKFASVYESVYSYVKNLNSHQAYGMLRTIRAQLRDQGKEPASEMLALGLTKYSSRGHLYVKEIQALIKRNQLTKLGSLPEPA